MKIPLVLSIVVPLLSSIIASNAYAQTQPNAPFNIPAIEDDVKIITVNGKDNNGNTVSIEIIITRGTMMLSRNAMMMDPTMMFGMPMMMQMMVGMNMNQGMGMGMQNSNMQSMIAQMQNSINTWVRSHYIVQGGSLSINENAYMLEGGTARVSDGKVFINVVIDQGLNRDGKLLLWGTLDKDDGLKGRILLWEGRTQLSSTKIVASGSIEDAL
jgi:hypothetical protein